SIRGLKESELVHPCIRRERRNETDVRTFRRFNRTDTAVVSRVHVSNFESGAITGKTAGAKRGQTTLVGNLGERIRLIHELRELRGSEELLHDRRDRLVVNEILRNEGV